jgi:hypothetical protein
MRSLPFAFWLMALVTAGFSQSLPFDNPLAIHFQRTNLVVRWQAPEHPWPKTLWTFRVVRTQFSPTIISNVMALGPFTDSGKWYSDADGMVFGNRYGTPNLRISFLEGKIEYDGKTEQYSATNLAKNVPETNQLPHLAIEFLPKIGISPSDLAKDKNDNIKLRWPDDTIDHTLYMQSETTITNIEYRRVRINRALDGVEFRGEGGDGEVSFGENSKIVGLRLCWRTMERDSCYETATPETIIRWIRQGNAIQKRLMTGNGEEIPVDWSNVSSLTIKSAKAYYWGDFLIDRKAANKPLLPCRASPYAEISGVADIGKTAITVEIVCPILDESRPLSGNAKR